MSNSRRDFLKLIGAAAVALSAGASLASLTEEQRKLVVRHRYQYRIGFDNCAHRFDVCIDGEMYCVEAIGAGPQLTERETAPMLASLNDYVQARHGNSITVTA